MNLRIYLRLLRPIHALIWTAFYSFGVSRFLIVFHHGDSGLANWTAFAGLAPLLWGMAIDNAARALTHRPFFPALPRARNAVRTSTLSALAVSVVILAALAAWRTSASFVGAVGLASILATATFWMPRTGYWMPATMLPAFALVSAAPYVERAVAATPWLFLIFGVPLAAVSLGYAFSTGRMRERASIPYNSVGITFFAPFNHSATRRYVQEYQQWRAQNGKSPAAGVRPWKYARIPGSTWSWMEACWYSGRPGVRYLRLQLILAFVFALEIPVLSAFPTMFSHQTFAGFCDAVGRIVFMDPMQGQTHQVQGTIGIAMAGQGLFMFALAMLAPNPGAILPVSRRRLANVAFGMTLVQIAVTATVFPCFELGLSAAGYWSSHRTLSGFEFHGLIALIVALGPVLPLVAMIRTIQISLVRLFLAVVAGGATLGIAIARPHFTAPMLTAPGLLLFVGLTALSIWLLRNRMGRYYRQCDLLQDLRVANPQTGAWATG